MSRKIIFIISTLLAILLISLGTVTSVQGAEALPSYQLQYLGVGSPAAINNNGCVSSELKPE
jgi:hypothetical protein